MEKENVVSEDSQLVNFDIPSKNIAKLDNNSPIINAIKIFQKKPSIGKLRSHIRPNSVFSFD